MSRHEGVSCDSCLVSNFRGRRYKCLICYDYDLCANCSESGATSTRHSLDHPMQCILTRSDFDLYYGGEAVSPDQPHSFTCPFCKRMGFNDATLLDHVSAEHTDAALEVVCPVCAALPGGEPNMVTDDFAGHLTLEHRAGTARDLISFLDEPSAIRHGGVRRIPHGGRTLGGPRSRRANMHFSGSGAGLSSLSPSGRESVDLIAELQQQLNGLAPRRGAPQHSQLQQLQMQIQMERAGQGGRMERVTNIPRRQQPQQMTASGNSLMGFNSQLPNPSGTSISTILSVMSFNGQRENFLSAGAGQQLPYLGGSAPPPGSIGNIGNMGSLAAMSSLNNIPMSVATQIPTHQGHLLLSRLVRKLGEEERAKLEYNRVVRSQFIQSMLLSTFSTLSLDEDTPPTLISSDNDGAASALSDNFNSLASYSPNSGPDLERGGASLTSSSSSSSSHGSFKSAKSHKHTYKGSQKAPNYTRRHVPPSGGASGGGLPQLPKGGPQGGASGVTKHFEEAR